MRARPRSVPGGMKLDFECVKTHWNRGFIASWQGSCSWIVMLLASVWLESDFLARGLSRSRWLSGIRP
jgi:hypothetical protein